MDMKLDMLEPDRISICTWIICCITLKSHTHIQGILSLKERHQSSSS